MVLHQCDVRSLPYITLKLLQLKQVYVATADLDTTLRRLINVTTSARPLIVTDIGRSDLILGLTSANESTVGPHVTGILCTNSEYGRRDMSPNVHAILQVCPFLYDTELSLIGLVAKQPNPSGEVGLCWEHVLPKHVVSLIPLAESFCFHNLLCFDCL